MSGFVLRACKIFVVANTVMMVFMVAFCAIEVGQIPDLNELGKVQLITLPGIALFCAIYLELHRKGRRSFPLSVTAAALSLCAAHAISYMHGARPDLLSAEAIGYQMVLIALVSISVYLSDRL